MEQLKIRETDLFQLYASEVLTRCGDREMIHLALTIDETLSLISHLQLALRHPACVGPATNQVRRIVEGMSEKVSTTPAIREVIRRGWLEAYDNEG